MKLKLLLISAFNTLIVSFISAPHYVDETYEDEETGDTVRVVSGDGPAIRISSRPGKDDKLIYTVTLQAPTGPGLKEATTLKVSNTKVRDRIAALLSAAIAGLGGEGGDIKVAVITEDGVVAAGEVANVA